MLGFVRDENGWKWKTRFVTFHPISYGVGSLARLSIGLRSEGRRLMIHYFPRNEDPGPELHDHPWSFWTVMLWGCYTDESVTIGELPTGGPSPVWERDTLSLGSVRHRPATHRHRTIVHRPTVTVVFRGATAREWCEGTTEDWKCEGRPASFDETLGSS